MNMNPGSSSAAELSEAEKKAATAVATQRIINDPALIAIRPQTVAQLPTLLPGLNLNAQHVAGLTNMFGGTVDDSRAAIWGAQDEAMAQRIYDATKVPMPLGTLPHSFTVAPMDVMTHVVTDPASGAQSVHAQPLELNGPGYIGVTSAPRLVQDAIWNATRDVPAQALHDVANPLVILSISGNINDPNKMAHEKVATACLIAEGIEKEKRLAPGTVRTYTLQDLQAGTQRINPSYPAVVLGYTTDFTAALALQADGSFSLEGRKVDLMHNDRVMKNLDTVYGDRIDHTQFKEVNRTWAAGQGKEVFYEAANNLTDTIRGNFPIADRRIEFTPIELAPGANPSQPTAGEVDQGFRGIFDQVRDFHNRGMNAILKPSGSGNGIGITMIDRDNFPGQVQGVIDAKIASDVKQSLKNMVRAGTLVKSDKAAVAAATGAETARITPIVTQDITGATTGLAGDALRDYVINAKIKQMWTDVTIEYTNANGQISAGWPVTVAERLNPCVVNNPGNPLHDHTFEFRFPIFTTIDPVTQDISLRCVPTVAKVNANLGIGVNNTTAGTSSGAPILGGALQVPMNEAGLRILGVTEDQVIQMAQAACMMAAKCIQIHARDRDITLQPLSPLETALEARQDKETAQRLAAQREAAAAVRLGDKYAEYLTNLPPVSYTTRPDLAPLGEKRTLKYQLGMGGNLEFSSTYIPHPETNTKPVDYTKGLNAADRTRLGALRVVPAPDQEFRIPHDSYIGVAQDQSVLVRATIVHPDNRREPVALRLSPERINNMGIMNGAAAVSTATIRAALNAGNNPPGIDIPSKKQALERKAATTPTLPVGHQKVGI